MYPSDLVIKRDKDGTVTLAVPGSVTLTFTADNWLTVREAIYDI